MAADRPRSDQGSAAEGRLPTPEEVRGILPKPPPGGWPGTGNTCRARERGNAATSDFALLRRYLDGWNAATYRVDRLTLSPIEGSYVPRVTLSEALAALDRLEAAHAPGPK